MNANDIDLAAVPRPETGAVGRLVEDGAVVVIPQTGKVQVLNEIGARIWSLADGTRTVNEIVEAIIAEYDAGRLQVEADTAAFLGTLADKGALTFQASGDAQVEQA
ncbi:MAG: PqqD family protein [Anaerolineales bacterium]|nr:PqqD family protein [Anaerolineales bacterium]